MLCLVERRLFSYSVQFGLDARSCWMFIAIATAGLGWLDDFVVKKVRKIQDCERDWNHPAHLT